MINLHPRNSDRKKVTKAYAVFILINLSSNSYASDKLLTFYIGELEHQI